MDSMETTTLLVKALLEKGLLGTAVTGRRCGETSNFVEATAMAYKVMHKIIDETTEPHIVFKGYKIPLAAYKE